ncbi:MAG: hypothetical protein AB7F50_02845 [Fimbriimonadaceae bacterium]
MQITQFRSVPFVTAATFASSSSFAFTPFDQLSPDGSTSANCATASLSVKQIFPELEAIDAKVMEDFNIQGTQLVRGSATFYFDLPGAVPSVMSA